MKTMKSTVIDWITPPGQNLSPPLSRKVKTTRGFHHERTSALLCPAGVDWSVPKYALLYQSPARCSQQVDSMKTKLKSGEMSVWGDQWPLFLYADLAYDPDDPWNGLLRSQLLVAVCENYSVVYSLLIIDFRDSNTFSRLPAPSMMMNQKLQGREMHAFMAW
jgi:hypothetical protein